MQLELDTINKDISHYMMQNTLDNADRNTLQSLYLRKEELEIILNKRYDDKAKGYCIRSRAKWIKEGELGSRYFLGLEKQRQASNVIREIKVGDSFVNEGSQTLSEIVNFYTSLYKDRNIPIDKIKTYLQKNEPRSKLNDKDKKFCDNTISKIELCEAVESLKANKSPGIDGLTPEFYKKFWPNLEKAYVNMLQETFVKGILPISTRKAVLALIHKKGDRNLLTNYRPISLSNYDYKILTSVFAKRIQQILPKLISKDQSGYIKERYIGLNARLISDIIDNCENNNIPGAIVCLDFEKAFDSLNWNFLFLALEKYGFGKSFIQWIKIFYNKPTFCVKNNGVLSKESVMERGIQQGCAVSALLFILCIEYMSNEITKSPNVSGIKLYQLESCITLYADDATLTLSDERSVSQAIFILKEFSSVSGLKLNIAKCNGLWLGPLKNNPQCVEGITFSSNPIKCLGIYIGTDKENCNTLNWNKKIAKLE